MRSVAVRKEAVSAASARIARSGIGYRGSKRPPGFYKMNQPLYIHGLLQRVIAGEARADRKALLFNAEATRVRNSLSSRSDSAVSAGAGAASPPRGALRRRRTAVRKADRNGSGFPRNGSDSSRRRSMLFVTMRHELQSARRTDDGTDTTVASTETTAGVSEGGK